MIRLHLEWQDARGVADTLSARTWARIVIRVDGRCVTKLVDHRSGSLRDGIYGSVLPLCNWIVENWWFLLNEAYRFPVVLGSRELGRECSGRTWVQRHSLLAAQEGSSLPDMTLHRDGSSVLARWIPDGEDSPHTFIRFAGSGEVRMEPASVEQGLAEFVGQVIDRIEGFDCEEATRLRAEWSAIGESTKNERELCEWSARLGLDPYSRNELTDEYAAILSKVIPGLEVPVRYDLLDVAQPGSLVRDIAWLSSARTLAANAGKSVNPERCFAPIVKETAHASGYECAVLLRQHMGRAHSPEPVGHMDRILVQLGWADRPSIATEFPPDCALDAVLERSAEGAPVVITPRSHESGMRFKLARSIYLRHFCGNRTRRRLATKANTRDQRASRSFAAELLAPATALANRIGEAVSHDEIVDLATDFGVNPLLISHQIQNHNLAWIEP